MTKTTLVIDYVLSDVLAAMLCSYQGEARMRIWDKAALGRAAFVTVPAVALPLLSRRTASLPSLKPWPDLCCAASWDPASRHRRPVRHRLFVPTLVADDGKLFVQFGSQRRSPAERGHLLARTRAVASVLIHRVGNAYWVSGRAAGPFT